MNDGQVDKMFQVFGAKSIEIVSKFTKLKKNRFYVDFNLIGDSYCDFMIIDASEIKGENLDQWIEGIALFGPLIFIVEDNQYLAGDSLVSCTSKLNTKYGNSNILSIKNHRDLLSVLEGIAELQNGFSLVCVDFADFHVFMKNRQYYWSDTVYSHSIEELILNIVEKLENVKARAQNTGLKLSGLFGCLNGNITSFESNICEEFELIKNKLMKVEPFFNSDASRLIIHTNVEMSEKIDIPKKPELGFHMLWALSGS
jgi:hypothetical protein